MRRWLALVLLALMFQAATAATGEVRLAARETLIMEYPGASAAFAVDSDIVEATARSGQVVLVGRRAGQTPVTVVTPATVETLMVHVEPAAGRAIAFEAAAARAAGIWEGSYDSASRRSSTGLTLPFGEGERTGRLRLYGIHQRAAAGDRDTWALPTASLELKEPGRSLVLLDEHVDVSPLTLNRTVLRGLHLRDGPLEMHAGIASATPWNDLLLPSSGDRALALSYRSGDAGLRLVPGMLWLPDSGTKVPGVVSLGLERGADDEPLRLKAEIAWSEDPAISFDVNWRTAQRQVWLQGASRPASFAALDVARPAGNYLDAAWSEGFGARTTAALTLAASRLDLPDRRPQAASGRLELRHQTTDQWSFTAGAGGGGYRDIGAAPLRRSMVSLGSAYDTLGFGIAALYRYQEISAASRGGHGGRVTVRGASGGWRANFFVDAQQQAPTLELVLKDRPDLARAFAELGIVPSGPEELVRLLRDNAALLAEHGVAVGDLSLDPLRVQGGLDVSWRDAGLHSRALGLRLLVDDGQGGVGGRRTRLGTLYTSWRIFGDAELSVSFVRWSRQHDGSPTDRGDSYQVTLRTSFSPLSLPGASGRPISGRVLRDDLGAGVPGAAPAPLAGVEVVLDGWRYTRTDRDGSFVFDAPGYGQHRVEALLPPQPGAYFTAPSAVMLPPGGEARFAITFSAARLSGVVRSDAGLPLAGVTLRLAGMTEATATTDSSGAYRFAAPAGEARVSLDAVSVPPGYELGEISPQSLRLAQDAPAVADFTVRAQRALAGVVRGAGDEPLTVTALEADRTVSPDKTGRFRLRGLPAGPLTLLVKGRLGQTRQIIELPAKAGSVTHVELAAPCSASAPKESPADGCLRSAVDRGHGSTSAVGSGEQIKTSKDDNPTRRATSATRAK